MINDSLGTKIVGFDFLEVYNATCIMDMLGKTIIFSIESKRSFRKIFIEIATNCFVITVELCSA